MSPMLCPHPLQANETFALVGNVTHYAQVWLNISAEIRGYLEQGRLQQHLHWLQQVLGVRGWEGGRGAGPPQAWARLAQASLWSWPPPAVCGGASAAPRGPEPLAGGAAAGPAPGQLLTAQRLGPPAAARHHRQRGLRLDPVHVQGGWAGPLGPSWGPEWALRTALPQVSVDIFKGFPDEESIVNYTLNQAYQDNVTVFASEQPPGQVPAPLLPRVPPGPTPFHRPALGPAPAPPLLPP